MLKKDIGLRIKQLRAQKAFSQEELANACSLDRTYINSVENGRRNITIDSLNKIATALNVSLHDFFDFSTLNHPSKYIPATKNMAITDLKVGESYTNAEVINIFKCSNSGGIRVNNTAKTIALITHHQSILNPYEDKEIIDGKFVYTGMGQRGDQKLETTNQNGKIAYSNTNGYTLYYFVCYRRNEYTYMGEAILDGKPYFVNEKGIDNKMRKVAKFPLKIK